MPKVQRATPQETIEALLEESRRSVLPLSYRFIQRRDSQDRGVPGPLAAFVTAHNNRGLHQYLLAHAAASGGQFEVTRDSRVWARALGLADDRESARAAVSKGWAWLERARLIRRGRRGRLAQITLLSDDGSGEPYRHPYDQKPKQDYITLPYAFWRKKWHEKLDLPSLALLLIGMSLGRDFILPQSHVQQWYGISAATLSKGIAGLRRHDLIAVTRTPEPAPLAPEGFRFVYRYTMREPFHRRPPSNKKVGGGND
jgi:hypothetical protein